MKPVFLHLLFKFSFLLIFSTPSTSSVIPFQNTLENLEAQTVQVQNPIGQEEEPDQITLRIQKKIESMPYCMRSIFFHDLCGLASATTSSFVPKFLGGISICCLSSWMLKTTIAQSKLSKSFFHNTTIEDLISSGLIINFSQMNPATHTINITEYVTNPYEEIFPSLTSYYTATLGFISGSYSIFSSFIDLFTAGYDITSCRRRGFMDIIEEVIEDRGTMIGKDININNIDAFLDYAVGEYMDMYQKRGIFNETRFISLLKRY